MWQDLVSDLEVLQRCKTISIETNIRHRQLRWCGHIARMSDQRLPKQLLYGELKTGKRPQGRPRKRYKNEVRVSLSKFRLPDLKEAGERSRWRTLLHQGSRIAENDRSEEITEKKIRRKNPDAARDRGHNCTGCGKQCASAAGLAAHRRWKH